MFDTEEKVIIWGLVSYLPAGGAMNNEREMEEEDGKTRLSTHWL